MLIPEDGSLPPITRTGFTPFNNVMVVKITKNAGEKGKTVYNLVTLDSSKKGERWPAENCSEETNEIIKESTVPELIKSKINSTNVNKSNMSIKKKQRIIDRRKANQRKRNKQKFGKKNGPKETRNYHNSSIDEIDPWLPTSALSMGTHILPQVHNQTFPNSFNQPLLENNSLLGSGPRDMNNIPLMSTLQNRPYRNIVPTDLPISESHSTREIPPVNTYHTNFRNKPMLNDKYDHRFDDPYSNNSVLPKYSRSYDITEKRNSSISPHFKDRFETQVGNSYESSYKRNPGDPVFRNYDNFNASPMGDLPEDSYRMGDLPEDSYRMGDLPEDSYSHSRRLEPLSHPSNETFIGTERDFQIRPMDDGLPRSYRKSLPPNKFARDCVPEAFNETNAPCYREDVSFNAGYNEMPRNNFGEFSPFQNNFSNNSGDQPRKNMIENSFMGTKFDYNSNNRLSEGSSHLNKSYENYTEVCRENQTDFYEQYENDMAWNNGFEGNSGFRDNHWRNPNQFHSRNKSSWKKGSFSNFKQNKPMKGRNNHRFEKK